MNIKDFNLIQPNSIDYDEIEQKGLGKNNQLSEKYFNIYAIYRKALEMFLESIIGISRYDTVLKNSSLNFPLVLKEEKDFYQSFNTMDTSYIYLRNNIYIERLSSEDVNYLANLVFGDIKDWNPIIALVQRTYKNLIREVEGEVMVNFGQMQEEYFADNGAIVFGVRYDQFSEEEKNNPEWEKIYLARKDFMRKLLEKFKEEMLQRKIDDVVLLEYDSYGVFTIEGDIENSHDTY